MPKITFDNRELLDEDLLCALRDEADAIRPYMQYPEDPSTSRSAEWFAALIRAVERQLVYGNSDEFGVGELRPRVTRKGIALHAKSLAKAKANSHNDIDTEDGETVDESMAVPHRTDVTILIQKACFDLINLALLSHHCLPTVAIHALNAGVIQLAAKTCDDYIRRMQQGSDLPIDKGWIYSGKEATGCLVLLNVIYQIVNSYPVQDACKIAELARKHMKISCVTFRRRANAKLIDLTAWNIPFIGKKRRPNQPTKQELTREACSMWGSTERVIGLFPTMPPPNPAIDWLYDCNYQDCPNRVIHDPTVANVAFNHTFKPYSQRCSRCKQTKYCSNDCQKADWPKHKSECNA